MLTKNLRNCAEAIYLETGRNVNVYSRLISTVTTRQYSASGCGRDSGRLYESGYKTNNEKKALN